MITSSATFSAGIAHAASWREAGNVTFVGEPVGDEMDFWSEGGKIVLPNSGLKACIRLVVTISSASIQRAAER